MTEQPGAGARPAVSNAVLDGIRERVVRAHVEQRPLRLVGGDTKSFYGRPVDGDALILTDYRGVVAYEPTELVLTARGGTSLAEVDRALTAGHQMLGFEPPRFGAATTIGGIVAAGIAGPRRPFCGAVRDFVLGVRIMNGAGEVLRFGGQVMKNVAGYDVSRLMAGALGTLGPILEVSLRVLPVPELERSLRWECTLAEAHHRFTAFGRRPWPLSALSYDGRYMRARLSGHEHGVEQACRALGPDEFEPNGEHWLGLRDHTLPFFQEDGALWRCSVPAASPPLDLPGRWFWDWGGAQRWLLSDAPGEVVRTAAAAAGGHATRFRGHGDGDPFTPLSGFVLTVHRRLKQVFDPHCIFNPGRMYCGL